MPRRAPRYRGELHGVQLWVAQPDETRDGPPAFEHHAELPRVEFAGGAVATVLVGELDGDGSPARRDTDHAGFDLSLQPGRSVIPLRADFEHAVVVLDGAILVDGSVVEPGSLGYLSRGRDELAVEAQGPARALVVGGVPFPSPIFMWWNFVARTPRGGRRRGGGLERAGSTLRRGGLDAGPHRCAGPALGLNRARPRARRPGTADGRAGRPRPAPARDPGRAVRWPTNGERAPCRSPGSGRTARAAAPDPPRRRPRAG